MKIPSLTPYVNPVRNFALYAAGKSGNTMLRDWFMTNLGAFSFREVMLSLPAPHRGRFLAGMARRKKLAARIWIKGSASNADLRVFSDVYRATVSQAIVNTPEFQNTYKIAVVRNPASRVVSAYLDKFCGEDWNKDWVKDVVGQVGAERGISFNQFLDYLLEADPKTLNGHWCPQSFVFKDIEFDKAIKLEQLSEGFKDIEPIVGRRGAEVLGQRRQVQKYRDDWRGMSGDLVEAPSDLLIQIRESGGGVPPKEQFLTEVTRRKIAQIYAGDFERFSYSKP